MRGERVSSSSLGPGRLSVTERTGDGQDALDAFIVGLYQETFNLVVSYINRFVFLS